LVLNVWHFIHRITFSTLGGIALLTDLFREILRFSYVHHWLAFSTSAISSAGAINGCYLSNGQTVMWHTLRTTCHDERINIATRSTLITVFLNFCQLKQN
jgi:hypothetical protein